MPKLVKDGRLWRDAAAARYNVKTLWIPNSLIKKSLIFLDSNSQYRGSSTYGIEYTYFSMMVKGFNQVIRKDVE